MEPESPKMESRPPEVIERLAGLLIPPACREAVLGDLSERYSSPKQYLKAALRTVPWVIASQIRRTSRQEQTLSEFCAFYIGFYLAALWSLGSGLLLADAKWLLLIPPAAAGTIGLVRVRHIQLPANDRHGTLQWMQHLVSHFRFCHE
jgi:hypothetical protein